MIRVAILEASHWHVPLYLDGFDGSEACVVAVSDSTQTVGRALSDQLGAKLYQKVDDLLDGEEIDFAFAFGRHADMADIATALIGARVPFSLEKPCGMCAEDVEQLVAATEDAGIYASVPYIYRVSGIRKIIEELECGFPADFRHISFRFIAGAPQRYERWHCGWMLDPSQSGGGALMNLGGHFVDMFRLFTGRRIDSVSARMSRATHATKIEDYAVVTMDGGEGVTGIIETGYTYPDTPGEQREFNFSARSTKHYLRTTDAGLAIRPIDPSLGEDRTLPFDNETDLYYSEYARRVLQEWREGRRPSVGLHAALEAMKVVEASYQSARAGGFPITIR